MKRPRALRARSGKPLVRTSAEINEEKEWYRHFHTLTKRDMRQFFRTGFQQAKEALFDSDCFYVFFVPSFLDNPVMSHEEALTIEIAEKSPSTNEPTGNSKELLEYMISSCSRRKHLKSSLRALQIPLREHDMFRPHFEAFDQLRSNLDLGNNE